MNKAITDGVLLTPPVFANGLAVWSSGDGTPGSATYFDAPNAAFVPSDANFAGCLELLKTQATQKLRYMGETPLLPGCYLRVTVRVKAISGNLPNVRIAAWAGGAGGVAVTGIPLSAPSVSLTEYGKVYEISAIVGAGTRNGVDLVWGADPLYGHFGLDLTGANGGVVRVDDIEIEDITSAFLRDMMGWVDVKDYGAIGDGVHDNTSAFEAADAAAAGRRVVIPQGVYHLSGDVTFDNHTLFEGQITQAADKVLILRQDFDLPSYIEAFGDEALAFQKAFQALLNNSDHESLDLGGRKVSLTAPIDMQAAVPNKTSYATRRVIRNGQLEAQSGAAWTTTEQSSQASYDAADPRTLSGVANVANIAVGSLVLGAGVGREVYVMARDIAAQTLTLSAALYDAEGIATYTFRRFKYLLDFSGFDHLSKFVLSDIEFQCNGIASGVMLAPTGIIMHLRDCFFTRPKDRGLTSIGTGCQGMLVDRCQFLSAEDALPVAQRVSIGLNVNANDIKLRNNRATRLHHFAVLGGRNHLIIGNHFFQGDDVAGGIRSAGLVLMESHSSCIITGNYVDNCSIEWTNEQDPTPDFSSGFSFSALTLSDNVFLCSDVASWFSYLVVRPHGTGHFVSGVSITGNKFRSTSGEIERVDRVDTSFAALDLDRMKNVTMEGNSFHGVGQPSFNPVRVSHDQNTAAATWDVSFDQVLPFGGRTRAVDAIVQTGPARTTSNLIRYDTPYVLTAQGAGQTHVHLKWPLPVTGAVDVIARMDG
jgi:hypothetical protein